ncbi:hypothetical protein NDU88_004563 [Pleurodeles waltl]|uniref:Uncharacterized protein n=1 Tax=Pleurodeles waltl TaxID=8319 RepID=A0AAV7V3D4_PLEWA|nr:hypothetical protein NDU88_004563 [Pleurodeles waltl]
MCRLELQELPRSREPRGGSNTGFGSPGALWDRAALELRRSQRTVAQVPLRGEAGRGRVSTGKGWLSPERLKAHPGGCRKVRSESGASEGPVKLSGGQQGRPLLWNTWSGAQLQGDGEGPREPRDEAITTCVLGQALKKWSRRLCGKTK